MKAVSLVIEFAFSAGALLLALLAILELGGAL